MLIYIDGQSKFDSRSQERVDRNEFKLRHTFTSDSRSQERVDRNPRSQHPSYIPYSRSQERVDRNHYREDVAVKD